MENKTVLKAGGIVIKKNEEDIRILLIYRAKQQDWTFPKGHVEQGESENNTAKREIFEECGINVTLISELPEYEYVIPNKKIDVNVHMFAFYPESFDSKLEHKGDMVEWVPIDEVCNKLSHANLKEYFEKVESIIREIVAK